MAQGLGVNQMKIRSETISAHIEINSHPDKGTLILIQIPILFEAI
jgi:signal transduction histidine kinase